MLPLKLCLAGDNGTKATGEISLFCLGVHFTIFFPHKENENDKLINVHIHIHEGCFINYLCLIV